MSSNSKLDSGKKMTHGSLEMYERKIQKDLGMEDCKDEDGPFKPNQAEGD
jgi:hypothetical protein